MQITAGFTGFISGLYKTPVIRKFISAVLVLFIISCILISACSKNDPPFVTYFPVQNQVFETYASGAAGGTLILQDGCLRLKYKDNSDNTTILPLWPYGFSYDVVKGRTLILNEKGELAARVGDYIYVGGASISIDLAQKYTVPPLPANVPGPYWLAGGNVRNDARDLEKAQDRLGLPH